MFMPSILTVPNFTSAAAADCVGGAARAEVTGTMAAAMISDADISRSAMCGRKRDRKGEVSQVGVGMAEGGMVAWEEVRKLNICILQSGQ